MPADRSIQRWSWPAQLSPALWQRRSAAFVFPRPWERRPQSAPPARAQPPSCIKKGNGSGPSLETNQIFHHTAVIATDAEIPEQHKLIVQLEARGRLLLPSARIDSADIQI